MGSNWTPQENLPSKSPGLLELIRCEDLQKHSSGVILWKNCSEKFHKTHRKTPVMEYFLNNVDIKTCSFASKGLNYKCFPVNFAKFFREVILEDTCKWLLLKVAINNFFCLFFWLKSIDSLVKTHPTFIFW